MRVPPNSGAFCTASKGWGLERGGVSLWLPAKLALADNVGSILEGSKSCSSLGRWTPAVAPPRPQAGGLGPSGRSAVPQAQEAGRRQSAPSEKRPGPPMRLPIFGEMGRKWRGSGVGPRAPRCWDGRSCLKSPSLTFALDHSGHDSGRSPMFIFYFSCSAG